AGMERPRRRRAVRRPQGGVDDRMGAKTHERGRPPRESPLPRKLGAISVTIFLVGAAAVGLRPGHPAAAAEAPNTPAPAGWSSAASLPSTFTPRWDFSVAYFPPTEQMVLFGGAPAGVGDPWYDGTWLYINGTWSKGPDAPAGLTPRGGAAMAYFPPTGQLVLFGGAGADWPAYNDTWFF